GLTSPIRKFQPVHAAEGAGKALVLAGKPLVKGLLNRGGMSVLYGESNSGKSFVGLDLGYHIGKGVPWCGRKVHRGAVVYLAAEGGAGIYARLGALERHYGPLEDALLFVVPSTADLIHGKADTEALLAEILKL